MKPPVPLAIFTMVSGRVRYSSSLMARSLLGDPFMMAMPLAPAMVPMPAGPAGAGPMVNWVSAALYTCPTRAWWVTTSQVSSRCMGSTQLSMLSTVGTKPLPLPMVSQTFQACMASGELASGKPAP